jgi:hypothetical protein
MRILLLCVLLALPAGAWDIGAYQSGGMDIGAYQSGDDEEGCDSNLVGLTLLGTTSTTATFSDSAYCHYGRMVLQLGSTMAIVDSSGGGPAPYRDTLTVTGLTPSTQDSVRTLFQSDMAYIDSSAWLVFWTADSSDTAQIPHEGVAPVMVIDSIRPLSTYRCLPGQLNKWVSIYGTALGDTGTVTLSGDTVAIRDWTATKIDAYIPEDMTHGKKFTAVSTADTTAYQPPTDSVRVFVPRVR